MDGWLLNDVGVGLQLLEDRYLPHRGGGDSLILIFQLDLLNRHIVLEDRVSCLEDNPIGALSQSLALLIALLHLAVHFSRMN